MDFPLWLVLNQQFLLNIFQGNYPNQQRVLVGSQGKYPNKYKVFPIDRVFLNSKFVLIYTIQQGNLPNIMERTLYNRVFLNSKFVLNCTIQQGNLSKIRVYALILVLFRANLSPVKSREIPLKNSGFPLYFPEKPGISTKFP